MFTFLSRYEFGLRELLQSRLSAYYYLAAFSATGVQNFVYYAAWLSALAAGVLLAREITNATIRSL